MSATIAITLFALALLAEWEVTARVPVRLHTALMSVAGAVGGIVVVGAVAIAAAGGAWGATAGLAAVTAATANAVGGMMLADRLGRPVQRRKENRP